MLFRIWQIFKAGCWLLGFLIALPLIVVFFPLALIWAAFNYTDVNASINQVYGRGMRNE